MHFCRISSWPKSLSSLRSLHSPISTRDVIFHEIIFPFSTQQTDVPTDSPFSHVLPLPCPDQSIHPNNTKTIPISSKLPEPDLTTFLQTPDNQVITESNPNTSTTSPSVILPLPNNHTDHPSPISPTISSPPTETNNQPPTLSCPSSHST